MIVTNLAARMPWHTTDSIALCDANDFARELPVADHAVGASVLSRSQSRRTRSQSCTERGRAFGRSLAGSLRLLVAGYETPDSVLFAELADTH